MRLAEKIAIVVGAGQTPGETIGNGRATAVLFAREGARLVLADRDLESARETERMIREEGGEAVSFEADVTSDADCRDLAEFCADTYGRIDILHNNVGIGAGDTGVTQLSEEVWDRILDVNLKGMWLTSKHVLTTMRQQGQGCITNVSSVAAVAAVPLTAYKVSKAGVNALTHTLATGNAEYGIRANAILPGLMDTPMAVDALAGFLGVARSEVAAARDALVPLGHKMGTAWDVAHAAVFLASDEASFITGALLPVDGGQSAKIG